MANESKSFKRQLFGGYRRRAVDEHLASVDASIIELRGAVEQAATPDHQELVMRATRRFVEEVLEQAENDAARIRADAEDEAARVLRDAYSIASAHTTGDAESSDDGDSVIDLRPDDDETAASPVDEFSAEIAKAVDS